MIIQSIKFPDTPEEAVAVINELRPMLDAYFNEVDKRSSERMQTEMLVMMWHSFMIDFIEVVDHGERVGVLMFCVNDDTFLNMRGAMVLLAYTHPEYRGNGYFKAMLKHLRTISQARRFKYIDVPVNAEVEFSALGKLHIKTYREEM